MTMLTSLMLLAAVLQHPVYPPQYDPGNIDSLRSQAAESLSRSPRELYDLVPSASGIFFIGCPNCHGGAQENGVFTYRLELGDRVQCRHCDMIFPNEQFPNNRELRITAPSGAEQTYRWHQTESGSQHFFEAHAWWHRWQWTQAQALLLANLFALSGDAASAERAAALVGRFAQVFPDYPVRIDHPFKPKEFFPADQKPPYGEVSPYRAAKFYWWGYGDVPATLARAYDLIAPDDALDQMSELLGSDIRQRIERDLLRLGYEFAAAHHDDYTNMAPGMYRDMIIVGRVIGDPEMVREPLRRLRTLLSTQFFEDGWWHEGTPSYHWQTVSSILQVEDVLRGYVDPEAPNAAPLDLKREMPVLARAVKIHEEAVLPDGRMIPMNDTWWEDRVKPTETSTPRLWPALGYGILGEGSGETQFQVHLNWSGGFGHAHADNGSILLFAHGKELLSDLGYTHTRMRNWAMSTAAHNTVVVDMRSQPLGSASQLTQGKLLRFETSDNRLRVAEVDASPAYAQCSVYRRRLTHLHLGEGHDVVLDEFEVEGGSIHDWFLHGSADEQGAFSASIPLEASSASLVPDWGGQQKPENETQLDLTGEQFHPYLNLHQIASAPAPPQFTVTWTYGGTALRTQLFAEPGSTLHHFLSPAIRGANEDEAKLDQYQRQGIMLRHAGPKSRFIAVHEPYKDAPWIREVKMEGSILSIDGERLDLENGPL